MGLEMTYNEDNIPDLDAIESSEPTSFNLDLKRKRNREAAQRSRMKTKELINQLRKDIDDLEKENGALKVRLCELERNGQTYRHLVQTKY